MKKIHSFFMPKKLHISISKVRECPIAHAAEYARREARTLLEADSYRRGVESMGCPEEDTGAEIKRGRKAAMILRMIDRGLLPDTDDPRCTHFLRTARQCTPEILQRYLSEKRKFRNRLTHFWATSYKQIAQHIFEKNAQ